MYVSFEDIRTFDVVGRAGGTGGGAPGAGGADDVLGTLHDVYIDTRDWRIAWLVLETGGWFASHKVLLGTERRVAFDLPGRRLVTDLARYDIETAPEAAEIRTASDRDAPPPGANLFLAGSLGAVLPFGLHGAEALGTGADAGPAPPRSEEERHLRSAREVIGYTLVGRDEEVGPVRDLLIDRETPEIAWLSVDTGGWLVDREVVVRPRWATRVSWPERCIEVELDRERVRAAPPLDTLDGLDRAYASSLARFYRFPGG